MARPSWGYRLLHAAAFARARFSLLLLLLFTSTLQGYVAQAHVHVPAGASTAAVAAAIDSNPFAAGAPADDDDRGKRSRGDSSSSCPLCQAHSLGGAPLAHCSPQGFLPALASCTVPVPGEPVDFDSAISFAWTGRGPPLG